ncbi:murein DD-endopeptidase MepM [Pasteurella caecimuris]|uniref:murein DD-endopeptidase MepM n=1 Tax=Rodentibacter caecimuris TaxID=1796644 RepID=UPI00215016AC|nr:murein DD-endopeptidase MepM [Pasteurella caecimuris]MCR1836963.1 murein DD-endopeptidase MepM [Pasteurella caecimuris]MCU0107053.1 murein DD-endopeptidase MepM [Pasteurella caecimuris]
MQHVKLARDRRKRKSRIKAAIFFVALALIFSGVMLGLKESTESEPSVQTNLEPEMVDDVQYQPLKPEENTQISQAPEQLQTEEATSYDDELQEQDDEVEEVKSEFDDLNDLPQDAQDALSGLLDVADQALRITHQFSHTVVRGDTLKDVLELSGLEDDTAKGLIASYPELKNLRVGQQFYWILDKNDQLEYLNWLVSEKEERIYERVEEGKFKRQILEKQSVWKKEVLKGKVSGSFAASLRSLGLEGRQIAQLTSALQWQVSLRKLKKDTKFSILVSREYLGDKLTGQGNVEAIHILTDGKSYYAIQAANGRYYNQQGETLGKGFARYPLQRQARVSSGFNPNRRHPVTGRVRPHKGVDFSVPQGTPVIAPADGLVEKVAYQAGGAGRYVVLRHGREYQTVYMHLSRPLVRAGQAVKKGERIALSGNTGISTGPHLHYEFHINGRAVNPLTVKLPGTSSMATAERKQFLRRAKEAERMLKI